MRRPLVALACLAILYGCVEHRRQTSNVANAAGTLRAVRGALLSYRKECGDYPATLARLGPPATGGTPSCDRLDTLRPVVRAEAWGDLREQIAEERVLALAEIDAARPVKGYLIEYRPGGPLPNGRFEAFEISADPVERGVTGFWSLWASDSEEIHMNEDAPAGPKDRAMGR